MLQKVNEQNEKLIIKRAQPKLTRGDQAQVVFQGKIFKVWQWSQQLYDNSQAIFESLSRADTTTILALTTDKKIIMTRQSQPGFSEFLSLPGGIMDEGETVLQTAKRELLEETGFASRDWYFLFSGQMTGKIDWADFYLVAKDCQEIRTKQPDAGEKIDLEFLDFNQFEQIVGKQNFRNNDFALWYLREGREEVRGFLVKD